MVGDRLVQVALHQEEVADWLEPGSRQQHLVPDLAVLRERSQHHRLVGGFQGRPFGGTQEVSVQERAPQAPPAVGWQHVPADLKDRHTVAGHTLHLSVRDKLAAHLGDHCVLGRIEAVEHRLRLVA